MPSKNIDTIKKHRDRWYRDNKRKQMDRQLKRRKELKTWLLEYKKQQSCADCGMLFLERPECCDFHHLDPASKIDRVSKMVLYSRESALRELQKCIVLCANCHRTRHRDKYYPEN